jgi:Flp pilus assembly protein TadG
MALLMVFLMAMVAFAVDIGYIVLVRTQLQNAADSAALAGTSQLLDPSLLQCAPNQSAAMSNAATEAQKFASSNMGGGVALNLVLNPSNDPNGDIVCGYLSNPSNQSQPMDFTKFPNSVQVRVRRDTVGNGSVSLFFAGVLGINTQNLEATATATYRDQIVGFQAPGTTTCSLLPLALNVNTWYSLLAGGGPDNFARDPTTGAVTAGSDGIPECQLYPLANSTSGGNFGTVNIGTSPVTMAILTNQIQYGPSSSDLSGYPGGVLQLDPTSGLLYLNGDTGVSTGVKGQLASIIGQPRVMPLYQSVSGSGDSTQYTIVGFAGVTITEVVLTGSLSNQHLTIQPCFCIDQNAVTGTPASTPSWFVYNPLALTR